MFQSKFQRLHSELISYYQLIETKLKFICSKLLANEEKGLFDRLDDFENDSFGVLVHKIQEIQQNDDRIALTEQEIKSLNNLRKERNYWIHQCYVSNPHVTFTTKGELKNPAFATRITEALNEAIEWDKILTGR